MRAGTTGQAQVEIEGAADALYDLVSDVTRMGEWSPETTRCRWIDGASGPEVGARFRGTNRKGLALWATKVQVVVADPGRELAFVTSHRGQDMTRWSYRFEPSAAGWCGRDRTTASSARTSAWCVCAVVS
jgi:hypothetical protein